MQKSINSLRNVTLVPLIKTGYENIITEETNHLYPKFKYQTLFLNKYIKLYTV